MLVSFRAGKLKALAILPLLALLQIAVAADVMRMVGVGIPILIAMSASFLDKVDRGHAALFGGAVAFHFFCVNHHIGMTESFVLTIIVILSLIWLDRVVLCSQLKSLAIGRVLARRSL